MQATPPAPCPPAMPEALLEIQSLRIDYDDLTAVRDVSLRVPAGEVCGLIGPNGAGKTSLMRAVAGLVEPTYRVGQMLEWTQLGEVADQRCGDFSRGMRQRLFLAKTLLHEPDVVVLDEPASGLGHEAREHLAAVVRGLGAAGKAVLVSSHILTAMESFCTSVAILEEGELLVSGRIDEIHRTLRPQRLLRLVLGRPEPGIADRLPPGRGSTRWGARRGCCSRPGARPVWRSSVPVSGARWR